jgi:uncharacterized protein
VLTAQEFAPAVGLLEEGGEPHGVEHEYGHAGRDGGLTPTPVQDAYYRGDRHPDLQIIVGHWGEVVLFYLERIDACQKLLPARVARPVSDYFRSNVYLTGSGMLSHRYLRWAREVVGAERILYATDYPFVDVGAGQARRFLEEADVTDAEREAIGHGTWERLTAHLG